MDQRWADLMVARWAGETAELKAYSKVNLRVERKGILLAVSMDVTTVVMKVRRSAGQMVARMAD